MRFLADENFNNDAMRGLLRVDPTLDIVRVQDTPLYGAADPNVLDWAAQENRILLTHDVRTMSDFAYQRIREGKPMTGVIEVIEGTPAGLVIEQVLMIIGACSEEEIANRVVYIPF